MRTPQDFSRKIPRASRRVRIALIVVAVLIIVAVFSLRGLAILWTDYLWFDSVHFQSVFRTIIATEIVLSVVFIAILFLLIFASLTVASRLAPRPDEMGPVTELVAKYRTFAASRAGRLRVLAAAVFAVLGGIGADRQWKTWDMFRYQVSFGVVDPQFHKDVSFYVFELPFINFLIGWAFDATVVLILLTAVSYYLNGGIVLQARYERVKPAVKAHLSVLLGILALIKAVAYYYNRLSLVLSRSHIVDGATATSVHASAPAKFLLMVIAVIAAVLLLANIRQRGWVLPTVGVALWALVSLLAGTVYPALYQSLIVNPSELTKEAIYIQRNIDATRAAYGINNVNVVGGYNYSPTVTTSEIQGNSPQAQINRQTIANMRLLDPSVNLVNTIDKLQGLRSYYSFNALYLDRYELNVNGTQQETATITSVRELNNQIPSGFVNQHLEYTHGYGDVAVPVGQSGVTSSGNPNFVLSGLPATASDPTLQLTEKGSQIYFDDSPYDGGYVIANTNTPELDYESTTGAQVTNHYSGSGGVDAGSIFRRAAFALRFGDANFILSGQIKSSSKVLFYRNVVQRAEKVAPFLQFGSNPYAVVLGGSTYWVLNAYTTTNNYPYSQEANLDGLPLNSGLQTNFNYVRNSVKVVVNAYNGKMYFFDMGTGDPILKVYERIFPGLFTPVSKANILVPGITAHWRYPENLFQIQTNMYGTYHLTNAAAFYSQAQAWAVSPDPGSGPLNSTPVGQTIIGANGQITTTVARLQPQYVEAALPDTKQTGVNFSLLTPYVPISASGSTQNLTAFIMGSSDPGSYGQLTLYQLPAGETIDGPGLIANAIKSNAAISRELTLYNQNGSEVELGEVDIVPIDNTLLYVEPIFVESTQAHIPTLDDVVVVYDNTAYHSSNASVDAALCQITNPDGSQPFSNYCNTAAAQNPTLAPPSTSTAPSGSSSSTTVPGATTTVPSPAPGSSLSSLLAQANTDLDNAQAALQAGNLGLYQSDVNAAKLAIQQANKLPASAAESSSASTTTAPASPSTTLPASTTTAKASG